MAMIWLQINQVAYSRQCNPHKYTMNNRYLRNLVFRTQFYDHHIMCEKVNYATKSLISVIIFDKEFED